MPKYDYHCDTCGETVEREFKFNCGLNTFKCECGGRMWKHISPPNIAFKGEGFYSTDR